MIRFIISGIYLLKVIKLQLGCILKYLFQQIDWNKFGKYRILYYYYVLFFRNYFYVFMIVEYIICVFIVYFFGVQNMKFIVKKEFIFFQKNRLDLKKRYYMYCEFFFIDIGK